MYISQKKKKTFWLRIAFLEEWGRGVDRKWEFQFIIFANVYLTDKGVGRGNEKHVTTWSFAELAMPDRPFKKKKKRKHLQSWGDFWIERQVINQSRQTDPTTMFTFARRALAQDNPLWIVSACKKVHYWLIFFLLNQYIQSHWMA